MQPIPGIVVARRVELHEPFDGHAMNGRQIAEDQIHELRLPGTVAVDKGTHSLGVLGPAVGSNEGARHVLW